MSRKRKNQPGAEVSFPAELCRAWARSYRKSAAEVRALRGSEYGRAPARHVLCSAYIKCVESMADALENGPSPTLDMDSLIEEYYELRPYIFEGFDSMKGTTPESRELDHETKNFLARQLVAGGMGTLEAAEVVNEKRRGAPPVKKQTYLEAYILHWRGMTIPEIVEKMCPCGKKDHKQNCCQEPFKQGIAQVRKLLNRYGLSVPKP